MTWHVIAPPALKAWFKEELAKTYAREQTDSPGMILGCPVWGAKYLALFSKFCLRSLLAPANLRALLANDARVVLFTDPDGFLPVWKAAEPLEVAGIKVEICQMPPEILAGAHDLHKFMVVSAVHCLLQQWAKRSGRGLHPLYPDHLYSERYFEPMGRHEAIAHGAVSINVVAALGELGTFKRGRALEVPARKLGDIGLRYLHQQMSDSLVVPGDELPRSQTLLWRGRDALHFAGPIFNPVWLSPRRCREAPVVFPLTFDVEIPTLTGGDFHIPGPDEEMVLVELSGKAKAAVGKVEHMDEWLGLAWLQSNFKNENLAIYRHRTAIPIEPNDAGLDEETIARHHAELMDQLPDAKLESMEAYFELLERQARPFQRS